MSSLLEQASLVVTPNGTKASKLYSVKPTDGSGDMTVVRETTATRVNSSGIIESSAVNVPRLDYTDSTCPSLLVEPQRTNRALYSNTFDNAYWTKTSVTLSSTSGGIIDGGNYYTVTCDGTTGTFKGIGKSFLNDSANTYSLSVFAKSGTSSTLIVSSRASLTTNDTFASFNLSNGTINSQNGGTANIVNYGNGWYRCTFIVVNADTFTDQASIFFGHPINAANGLTLLISGAQAEIGANATSYIPTTTASVTRNADVISKTGISSLIGQTEGTLFVDFVYNGLPINPSTDHTFASLGLQTPGNSFISVSAYSSTLYARVTTTQATIIFGALVLGNRYKCALSYKNNDVIFYVNGSLIGANTSATIPALSDLYLQNANNNSKNINSVQLYKTRLTNAELATLTTL